MFGGWEVRVRNDFSTLNDELIIYRRLSETSVEVIAGYDDQGRWVTTTYNINEQVKGLTLPAGTAEAVAEQVKPGPSSGELGVLQYALDLERNRVDNALSLLKDVVSDDRLPH